MDMKAYPQPVYHGKKDRNKAYEDPRSTPPQPLKENSYNNELYQSITTIYKR